MTIKVPRARATLKAMGCSDYLPSWVGGTKTDIEAAEHKITIKECKQITKKVLMDWHVLSLIHKHPGSWLSALVEKTDMSKGNIDRAIKRLIADNLVHTKIEKMPVTVEIDVYGDDGVREYEDGKQVKKDVEKYYKVTRIWCGPKKTHRALKPRDLPKSWRNASNIGLQAINCPPELEQGIKCATEATPSSPKPQERKERWWRRKRR